MDSLSLLLIEIYSRKVLLVQQPHLRPVQHPASEVSQQNFGKVRCMVLILGGNLEIGAHVKDDFG